MDNNPLLKKLQVKQGQRLAFLNAPPGYVEGLGQLPADTELAINTSGDFDWIHIFAKDKAELENYALDAIKSLKDGGTLWISYPKGTSKVPTDITRDKGWDIVRQAGFRPVSQVSIDGVWSALRFRPLKPGEEFL